jgi:hypothetical protein
MCCNRKRELNGSDARNLGQRDFAPHFEEYRMFHVRLQHASYGRACCAQLPFSERLMKESSRGVRMRSLPASSTWGLGEGTKLKFVMSFKTRGWALLGAAALCIALSGAVAMLGNSAHAGVTMEERKLPMKFSWVACQPDCRGWISAVGIVTADSPKDFEDFARGRQLGGVTVVLDSSGGSVNDSIALGRRWRSLGVLTTVGTSMQIHGAHGDRGSVAPEAYCESMCVFLLLSGKTRYVPQTAHIRVHQIWMGDRADDAKAASYTAQDMMIVERDIGRLAKYTFDMGGAGDLLLLSLNVPPWENLHELSQTELRLTNLITTDAVAEVLPQTKLSEAPVAELAPKMVQDRFVGNEMDAEAKPQGGRSTKTAEVALPTGGNAAATPSQPAK